MEDRITEEGKKNLAFDLNEALNIITEYEKDPRSMSDFTEEEMNEYNDLVYEAWEFLKDATNSDNPEISDLANQAVDSLNPELVDEWFEQLQKDEMVDHYAEQGGYEFQELDEKALIRLHEQGLSDRDIIWEDLDRIMEKDVDKFLLKLTDMDRAVPERAIPQESEEAKKARLKEWDDYWARSQKDIGPPPDTPPKARLGEFFGKLFKGLFERSLEEEKIKKKLQRQEPFYDQQARQVYPTLEPAGGWSNLPMTGSGGIMKSMR